MVDVAIGIYGKSHLGAEPAEGTDLIYCGVCTPLSMNDGQNGQHHLACHSYFSCSHFMFAIVSEKHIQLNLKNMNAWWYSLVSQVF